MFATERNSTHGTAALYGVLLVALLFFVAAGAMLQTVQARPHTQQAVCQLVCASNVRPG